MRLRTVPLTAINEVDAQAGQVSELLPNELQSWHRYADCIEM